jgi:hypothetical protein
MKQIPFLAFPGSEQDAVLRTLRKAGIAPRGVCVSRFELALQAARQACAFTTISAPGWSRTYPSGGHADWIAALESELTSAARSA